MTLETHISSLFGPNSAFLGPSSENGVEILTFGQTIQ